MNAIKLPVKIYHSGDKWFWGVVDADGKHISSREQAGEIALAINCHDALVEALEHYSQGGDGVIARAALAKVEDLRKKV